VLTNTQATGTLTIKTLGGTLTLSLTGVMTKVS